MFPLAIPQSQSKMTLTAPGCGMGPVLIEEVKERVIQAPGVTEVEVELVLDPPWSRDMTSEAAQLELGVFKFSFKELGLSNRMDIQELKDTFDFFDDWEDKYRFVIDLGKELPELPDSQRVDANLIRGCQSQVWLTHEVQGDALHLPLWTLMLTSLED